MWSEISKVKLRIPLPSVLIKIQKQRTQISRVILSAWSDVYFCSPLTLPHLQQRHSYGLRSLISRTDTNSLPLVYYIMMLGCVQFYFIKRRSAWRAYHGRTYVPADGKDDRHYNCSGQTLTNGCIGMYCDVGHYNVESSRTTAYRLNDIFERRLLL